MGRLKSEVNEMEVYEIAGKVCKPARGGPRAHKKANGQWNIYFGKDRNGSAVRRGVTSLSRADEIIKKFNQRVAEGQKEKAQEIVAHSSDAKTYALHEQLKDAGYTLEEAVNWFFQWMPERGKQIRVSEAWKEWERWAKESGKTDRFITSMRETYVGPKSKFYRIFHKHWLHHLNPAMIKEFVQGNAKKHKEDPQGWTRNNQATHLAKLTQFFNRLIQMEHLKVNPAENITRPKNKRGEDPPPLKHYFEADAIFSMLECACDRHLGIRDTQRQYGLAIILIVWGGIRIEETIKLEWGDIRKNEEGLWEITVREDIAKSQLRRVSQLPWNATTWFDQIKGILEEKYQLEPRNPIISKDADAASPINEKEMRQRQKRFRKTWRTFAEQKKDNRYEDPKTIAQNGLRHSCACYGIHQIGQDELMLIMGEADAKILAKHYRRHASKTDSKKLYSIPSIAMQEQKEAKISSVMEQGVETREEAIELLQGSSVFPYGRLDESGRLTQEQ